jgi:hypothetical protein
MSYFGEPCPASVEIHATNGGTSRSTSVVNTLCKRTDFGHQSWVCTPLYAVSSQMFILTRQWTMHMMLTWKLLERDISARSGAL